MTEEETKIMLQRTKEWCHADPERAGVEAEKWLLEFLRTLGYSEIVDLYESIYRY